MTKRYPVLRSRPKSWSRSFPKIRDRDPGKSQPGSRSRPATTYIGIMHLLFICLLVSICCWPIFTAALNEITRNRCELKLVADYEFFRVIGNGNYANAARYLINMVERVNGIFSPVDWGLDITGHRLVNIGFTIKEIKIFDRPNYGDPRTHFNSALNSFDGVVDPMEMLSSFSVEEGTNDTCLCLLITAKALSAGVLGLANIGDQNGDGDFGERGICARLPDNGTMYRNTALISVRRRNELMITRVVDLVAAHELGHAFGSSHDDVHDPECVPQPSRDGRYVMWESANTGYERNHYQFSPCSIRAIHRVLYALAHHCLVEERRALCGNGILEEGEQCDCGAQIGGLDDDGTSGDGDRCCTVDCKLKPFALCSPRHSECCTDECTFMEKGRQCQARNEEMCKDESQCSGTGDKCPAPVPLPDGSACPDEGKCRVGQCISFCASLSADLLPCLCEEEQNVCRRCCRPRHSSGSSSDGGDGGSNGGGHCAPVSPLRWLPEGSMCVHGQCQRDGAGEGEGQQRTLAMVCEKKATDTASFFHRLFNNLHGSAPRKFFTDYLVFIVVFLSLLVWCPCTFFIMKLDQQKHKQLLEKRNVVENKVQMVRTRGRVTPQCCSRALTPINGQSDYHHRFASNSGGGGANGHRVIDQHHSEGAPTATTTTKPTSHSTTTTTTKIAVGISSDKNNRTRSSDALESLLMQNGDNSRKRAVVAGGGGGMTSKPNNKTRLSAQFSTC